VHPDESKIWFPAKKYGWGWGPPNCWQGWAAFAVWAALLVGGALWFGASTGYFIAYSVFLGIALFIVCLLKGEKPRWRWGKN
jgi:hypothetical protein